eukprot:Blabericola_migrator_1__8264@NODE_4288_length_1240_cov_117_557545_g2649_i0_p1_GENE_NODE_4288_length_1240_cov_117_557545_g2649_i0NODE_4288_length_1240_cov_117_557545_g2649_i0_p1_ORF_typecomplete_len106_score17_04Phage_holin_3_6/PF07332_11/0_019DUF5129/PF17173_4/0_062ABC2_membrane_3/PF12698_7/0_069_NODE_4288_length_1240_cov_117_557545_g2649_i06861003
MPKIAPEAAIGGAALAGSIFSSIMGYPTGLIGQSYWQNEALLIGAFGAFGMISILVGGAMGVSVVLRRKDRKLRQRLLARKLESDRAKRQKDFDRKLLKTLRRRQ